VRSITVSAAEINDVSVNETKRILFDIPVTVNIDKSEIMNNENSNLRGSDESISSSIEFEDKIILSRFNERLLEAVPRYFEVTYYSDKDCSEDSFIAGNIFTAWKCIPSGFGKWIFNEIQYNEEKDHYLYFTKYFNDSKCDEFSSKRPAAKFPKGCTYHSSLNQYSKVRDFGTLPDPPKKNLFILAAYERANACKNEDLSKAIAIQYHKIRSCDKIASYFVDHIDAYYASGPKSYKPWISIVEAKDGNVVYDVFANNDESSKQCLGESTRFSFSYTKNTCKISDPRKGSVAGFYVGLTNYRGNKEKEEAEEKSDGKESRRLTAGHIKSCGGNCVIETLYFDKYGVYTLKNRLYPRVSILELLLIFHLLIC
jgi:hypothetical protein